MASEAFHQKEVGGRSVAEEASRQNCRVPYHLDVADFHLVEALVLVVFVVAELQGGPTAG